MAASLYRLGDRSCRHRRLVLVAWLAVLVGIGVLAGAGGGQYEEDLSVPGSRAQQVLDTVDERFPASSGASAQVVFVAPAGHRVAEYEAVIAHTLDAAATVPRVAGVVDPFTAGTVSPDGRVALAQVTYRDDRVQSHDALADVVRPARDAGLRVELGGYGDSSAESGRGTEVVGLLIALVVLVSTFGSLVAAGLPLLTALLGVGATVAGLAAVAGVLTLPATAPPWPSCSGWRSASTTRCSSSRGTGRSWRPACRWPSPWPARSARRAPPWCSPDSPWSSRWPGWPSSGYRSSPRWDWPPPRPWSSRCWWRSP
ncbi:putative membrane protein YdfJ with MMPL/SSD domain [Actinophytocola algeriensis]|uniref:Putative membrane protein YdfJ with MMPL/SSD domain n=1 Tax=Actinophytocola algeriensis TaxID=1768010 RepID=A0A7W7Q2U3_9PSEU|nr:putative membrane protein YdfJ with MMPL/SSD domain [Actinophytocola algeriensis]